MSKYRRLPFQHNNNRPKITPVWGPSTILQVYIVDDVSSNVMFNRSYYDTSLEDKVILNEESNMGLKYKRVGKDTDVSIGGILFKNNGDISCQSKAKEICQTISSTGSLVFMDLAMGNEIEEMPVGLYMAQKIFNFNSKVNIVFTSNFEKADEGNLTDQINKKIGKYSDKYCLYQGKLNLSLGNKGLVDKILLALDGIVDQNQTTENMVIQAAKFSLHFEDKNTKTTNQRREVEQKGSARLEGSPELHLPDAETRDDKINSHRKATSSPPSGSACLSGSPTTPDALSPLSNTKSLGSSNNTRGVEELPPSVNDGDSRPNVVINKPDANQVSGKGSCCTIL